MSRISILVPVYNVGSYLEQCLNSLRNQTFKDVEIICVDDGSTDCSTQILDRFAASDSRIRVIHKDNTGYGNSMNVALDRATGEYIAILESDDFAEPDMLQKLYETAVGFDVDVVKADYYHYSNGQDVYCNRLRSELKGRVLRPADCPGILNLADSIWSCLYKHSFLLEYGIRFHETPGASYQDISFAVQVWLYARSVYFIADPVLHYRRDNPDASMNNPTKLFCVFDEYEWMEEMFQNFWVKNPPLEYYFVASKYRDYFNHYYRVGVQYQYALLLRLRDSYREDWRRERIHADVFLPNVWQGLQEVEENLNSFFSKNAKYWKDERLDKCRIRNDDVYLKAFCTHLKNYSQVMVYGAGKIGQSFARLLLGQGGHVSGFIVTKLMEQNRECMGISVYEIQEVFDLAESCAVVIAVAEQVQYELYRNLVRYGFQNIYRVDEAVMKGMS